MIGRRNLIRGAFLVPVGLMLAPACSQVTNIPQFVADIESIAADLAKMLPDLQKIGVTSDTITKVTDWIHRATAIADAISGAVTTGGTSVSGLVSQFGSVLDAIISALGLNLPGTWGILIKAVVSLLPTILAAAGVVLARRYAAAPTMTPDQARTVLRQILAQ